MFGMIQGIISAGIVNDESSSSITAMVIEYIDNEYQQLKSDSAKLSRIREVIKCATSDNLCMECSTEIKIDQHTKFYDCSGCGRLGHKPEEYDSYLEHQILKEE